MQPQLENITNIWPTISNVFSVPHNEQDYNNLVSLLDELIDEVGENEEHYLASLIETIGNLIETYENKFVAQPTSSPTDVLKYLMNEHALQQTDLPEIGSQGVVSEIIRGKRMLNIRQIKALSTKFGVSPLVFIQST